LIGLGWAAVVIIACARSGESELRIDPHHTLEMRFLLLATLYSFVIPLNGVLGMVDAAVLLTLFALYVRAAMRGGFHEEPLIGPAALVDVEFRDVGRRIWALLFFLFGAFAIWVSAEPFAESLVHIGRNRAIDEFLLVQWVAPLASESPEFVVAILFALRLRGSVGIGALISSKVNQWTLLVGALPVAFCLSLGRVAGLPLDARQTEELLLTSAQSILATLVICDRRFSRFEAVLLAALFVVQLFFPSTEVRLAFAALYVAIFFGMLVHSPARRAAFLALLRPARAGAEGGGIPA
jgi:cation:H+ antiporter